jgi:thiol:disulfide interchange protein DsbG
MNKTLTQLLVIAGLAIALGGCSKTEPTTAASPAAAPKASTPAQTYDLVAAQGKGFTVGPMMSANTVYVLFDPQCPHCGHLWEAARPLLGKVKFVWVPVAIINGNSTAQGAALLTSPTPLETMTAHEAAILGRTGGMKTQGEIPADVQATIKNNTQLFTDLKLESVPFIVAKNATTGIAVTNNGALDTPALAQFLGVN